MATKELTYNDQPIEIFAKSAPRCSQCGAHRVRRDDGSFGACTNIECKNPVADYARENGLENPFHCGGEVDRDGRPRPRPVYPPAVPVCGHETGGPQPIVKALDDDLPDAGDLNDAGHGSCATDPCGKRGCNERTLKVYVASSWRNTYQPQVVKSLRELGFEVYDFKDSEGFSLARSGSCMVGLDAIGISARPRPSLRRTRFQSRHDRSP